MLPIILHIDFDSFFASVAQQDDIRLRNRPVGVTAANGRTAIIAASREAKKLGIKNVCRTYEAYEICPSLIVVPANFWRYSDVSKNFLRICNSFSPTVEMFSIDEVFMDVTLTAKLFGGIDGLIRVLKKRIKEELGECITASVGISYNKLLSKLASGLRKPNGVYAITRENLWATYENCALTDICGIGNRIAVRLNKIGIYKLLQLRDTSIDKLVLEFGNVEGHFLKQVGLGESDDVVNPYSQAPEAKSVGRNYCLPRNEYDKRVIYQNIFELCEEVALKLRRLRKKARTIGLWISGDESYHAGKTVSDYLDTGAGIFDICRQFLAKWNPGMVRRISVWSGNLVDSENTPLSLFELSEKKENLQETIDLINDRFGDHTIRNGFLLYSDKLTTVPNGFGADRWERKKLADTADK